MSEIIPVFRSYVPPEAIQRAAEVMERGWLGYGPECRALEERFTATRGGWALATSSCTSALYIAALIARRGPAPEVIVPAVTFVSTAMAFHHAGYRVRVAPVDPRTLMVTAETVTPLVNEATVAVVAVHLYGQRCPALPALRGLCDRHRLTLIEDAAHRLDLLDPQPPWGDLACYSFNAVKELPAGEGGMLWGSSMRREDVARAASNVGLGLDTMQRSATTRHAHYEFSGESGLKLRCHDIAAALVNGAIGKLAGWRARRAEQFRLYDRLLEPLRPLVRPLDRDDGDACLMYVIRVPAAVREALRREMAARHVATSVHYPSLADHPLFRPAQGHETPIAPTHETLVTLPTFLEMTAAQQRTVVTALEEGFKAASTASTMATPAAVA